MELLDDGGVVARSDERPRVEGLPDPRPAAQTARRPPRVAESRSRRVSPTRAESCRGEGAPSSGNSAVSILQRTGPTPATVLESTPVSRKVGLFSMVSSGSPSVGSRRSPSPKAPSSTSTRPTAQPIGLPARDARRVRSNKVGGYSWTWPTIAHPPPRQAPQRRAVLVSIRPWRG